MKKFLAWLLVILTVATSLPMTAFAEGNEVHDHGAAEGTTYICGGPEATHTKANCAYTYVETRASTCCTKGYSVYRCNECYTAFADDFVEIDPTNHTWEIVEAKAPTCFEIGWNEHKACSECGVEDPAMPRVEYPPVGNAEVGHVWDGVLYSGTCMSEEGVKSYTACSICGVARDDNGTFVPGSDKDHCWSEPEIAVMPTCDTLGQAVYYCLNCSGVTKTVAVMPLGHIWSEEIPASDPTCTTDGGEAHYACLRPGCDAVAQGPDYTVMPREDVIEPAYNHDWAVTYIENEAIPGTDIKVETCRRCGEVVKTPMAADVHDFGDRITIPTTCREPGRVYHVCRACGYEETIEDLEILAHDWTGWIVSTPVSCGADGEEVRTCRADGCTARETRVLLATGEHNFVVNTLRGDGGVKKPASCEEDGIWYTACTGCSAESTKPMPRLGHTEGWQVLIKATCTKEGVRNKYCTTCGKLLEENVPYFEPHTYEVGGGAAGDRTDDVALAKWYVEPVTCTTDGVRYHKCLVCDQEFDREVTAEAHGHDTLEKALANGVSVNVISAWSCTQDGSYSWICGSCDDNVLCTLEKEATGHEEVTVVVNATCTSIGYTYIYCTNDHCVESLASSYTHEGDTYPTTDEDGCAVKLLSFEITEDINPWVHDMVVSSSKESTCSVHGYDIGYCTRCQAKVKNYRELLPHAEGVLTERIEATCQKEGNCAYYTCKVCSGIYTVDEDGKQTNTTAAGVILPITDHAYSTLVPQVDPTCKNPGKKAYYTCATCSHVFDENKTLVKPADLILETIPHTWSEVAATPADCKTGTTGLKKHYKCTADGCGALTLDPHSDPIRYVTVAELVIPIVHNLTAVAAVAPSCTENGTIAYYRCSVCGCAFADAAGTVKLSEAALVDPAPGHMYVEVAAKAPTCSAPGYKAHFTCSGNCGKIFTKASNGDMVETTLAALAVQFTGGDIRDYASLADAQKDHTGLYLISETPADCTHAGVAKYGCSDCKTTGLTVITRSALGHLYDGGLNTYSDDGKSTNVPTFMKDFTCNGTYVKEYTCARRGCGCFVPARKLDDVVTHRLTDSLAMDKTCTTDGWLEHYMCTSCGLYVDKEGNEFEDRSHLLISRSHNLTAHEAIPSTCTKVGYYAYSTCDDCGKYFDVSGREVSGLSALVEPLKVHAYSDYIETVYPTCSTEGTVGHRTCATCSGVFDYNGRPYTGSMTLPKIAHTIGELVEAVPPTCSKTGDVAYYPCVYCDARFADAAGKVLIPDTTVATIPHTEETIPTVYPTCVETGSKDGKRCTVCGTVTLQPTEIPATGIHDVVLSYTETNALCGNYNYQHFDCLTCHKTDVTVEYLVLVGEPVEHDYVLDPTYEGSQPLTCTQDGIAFHVCKNCGDAQKAVTKAQGHKNADGELLEVSCMSMPIDRLCAVCGETVPTDHIWEFARVESTCTVPGYTMDYCRICEAWKNFVSLPAAGAGQGHTYTETVKLEAAYGTPGVKHYTCKECGHEHDKAYHLDEAGVRYTVDYANANGGVVIADSSLVKITVLLTSDLGVEIDRADLSVGYDAQVLEFVKAESAGAFALKMAQDDGRGSVVMTLGGVDADGKPASASVNSKACPAVVLTFRVCSATATGTTVDVFASETVGDGGAIPAEYMDAVIGFAKFLDINGDGKTDNEEMNAMYTLYEQSAYDACMDVDKDGEITLADIDKMYRYMLGLLTYEQMTAMTD